MRIGQRGSQEVQRQYREERGRLDQAGPAHVSRMRQQIERHPLHARSAAGRQSPHASRITSQNAPKFRAASSAPDSAGHDQKRAYQSREGIHRHHRQRQRRTQRRQLRAQTLSERAPAVAPRIMQSRRSGNSASQSSSVNTPMIAMEVEMRNSWSAHAAISSCSAVKCWYKTGVLRPRRPAPAPG